MRIVSFSGADSIINRNPIHREQSLKFAEKEVARVMLTDEQIANRIKELGAQISSQYEGLKEPLILVGVLKGSVIFLADLCRAIDIPLEIEFMGVSSYGDATESSGVVQITQDLTKPVAGRHVLLVEDIVDSGLTAKYLFQNLNSRDPASLGLVSLLEKPGKSQGSVEVKFCGFQIEDEFVVGYGLDLAGVYRNLPYVGVLKG